MNKLLIRATAVMGLILALNAPAMANHHHNPGYNNNYYPDANYHRHNHRARENAKTRVANLSAPVIRVKRRSSQVIQGHHGHHVRHMPRHRQHNPHHAANHHAQQRLAQQRRLAHQRRLAQQRLAQQRAAKQRHLANQRRIAQQRLAQQRIAKQRHLANQRRQQQLAHQRRLNMQR